jgi:hypothetical protein
MRKNLVLLGLVLGLLSSVAARAQVRHEIAFPDLPGYKTLKCDFHMHTVFSDGSVWPTVRVDEAWRQGLDAISLTDHIEYQPHKDDLPTAHDRPYELAIGRARERNLLFPKGAEITRDTPPGHFNAIFLSEASVLDTPDFVEAIKRANEQKAFVFWNHQEWKGPERGAWMDVHTLLYENRWFQGMEVCNGGTYYPTAHRWCLEKGLTMLGNSDVHDPDGKEESTPDDHRTLTLVFAKQRSIEGLKEALLAGQTAVWFQNQLIGRQEWLLPLFENSVLVEPPHLKTKNALWVQVRNRCDVDIRLLRTGNVGPAEITLPARTVTLLKVPTPKPDAPLELPYTAANLLIAPDQGMPITLQIGG